MGSLAIGETQKGTVWEPCTQPMDAVTCMKWLQLFYRQGMRGECWLSMTYHDTTCSMQGMCSSLFGGSERSMQKFKKKRKET